MFWCIIFWFIYHCFRLFYFTVTLAEVWISFRLRCLYIFLCTIPPNWKLFNTSFVVRSQLSGFNANAFFIPDRVFLFVLCFCLLDFLLLCWVNFVYRIIHIWWVVEGMELLVEFKFEFAQRFNFSIKRSYFIRQLLNNLFFSSLFILFTVLRYIIRSMFRLLLLVFSQSFRLITVNLNLLALTLIINQLFLVQLLSLRLSGNWVIRFNWPIILLQSQRSWLCTCIAWHVCTCHCSVAKELLLTLRLKIWGRWAAPIFGI